MQGRRQKIFQEEGGQRKKDRKIALLSLFRVGEDEKNDRKIAGGGGGGGGGTVPPTPRCRRPWVDGVETRQLLIFLQAPIENF